MTACVVLIDAGDTALIDALRAALVEAPIEVAVSTLASPIRADALHVLALGRDDDPNQARAALQTRRVMAIGATAAQCAELERIWPELDEISLASDPPFLLAARVRRLATAVRSDTAEQDAMTGALNRRGLVRAFGEAVQNPAPDAVTGLLLFNIDRFKEVNDSYGHAAGDQVLRGVVQAAVREAAPQDRLARVRGDSFVYLVTRYDRDSVVQDCRRLLARIAENEEYLGDDGGTSVRVTASAGLTVLEPGVEFDPAMRRVDVAMYEAKSRGRNTLVVHDAGSDNARNPDAHLRHFENVSKVASERVASLMAAMARQLLDAARAEAHRDSLTGLLNRRHFDGRIPREVDRARAQSLPLSVALMDLDRFHDINMTYGWVGGDAVLRRFAEVVTASVRLTDWAARYGGEEFVLVMPGVERAAALDVVERVR
jgi:two-component system cell cycle response regulator